MRYQLEMVGDAVFTPRRFRGAKGDERHSDTVMLELLPHVGRIGAAVQMKKGIKPFAGFAKNIRIVSTPAGREKRR